MVIIYGQRNALVNRIPNPQTPAGGWDFTEQWHRKYTDFTVISYTSTWDQKFTASSTP